MIADAILEGKQKVSARDFTPAQQNGATAEPGEPAERGEQTEPGEQAERGEQEDAAQPEPVAAGGDGGDQPVAGVTVEQVMPGEAVEPAGEGESVPVPTGQAPQQEGTAEAGASAATTEVEQ